MAVCGHWVGVRAGWEPQCADGVLVLVIGWEGGLLSRAAGCASALCANAVYRRWQAAPHHSHTRLSSRIGGGGLRGGGGVGWAMPGLLQQRRPAGKACHISHKTRSSTASLSHFAHNLEPWRELRLPGPALQPQLGHSASHEGSNWFLTQLVAIVGSVEAADRQGSRQQSAQAHDRRHGARMLPPGLRRAVCMLLSPQAAAAMPPSTCM